MDPRSVTWTIRTSDEYPSLVTRIRFAPAARCRMDNGVVPQPIPSTVTRAPGGSVMITS